MVKLQVIRLSDSDVTALYRRFPDMPAPQPCQLSLNLDDGSFSASYDDHRGSQATRPAGQSRILRWPIPCLTAIAANNVEVCYEGHGARCDGRSENSRAAAAEPAGPCRSHRLYHGRAVPWQAVVCDGKYAPRPLKAAA
jgi:hypothetical protein